jgi:putative flippase GtrA
MNIVRRWTAFNVVGAGGIAVQLGTLAALVHLCGWHYLAATAVAVEAAVVHNFVWHQRWTWRDRPAASWRAALSRLARFQILNGAISLAGNLVLMRLLAGVLRMDPVPANLAAIALCSVLNFAASEVAVFRLSAPAAALLLVIGIPAVAGGSRGGLRDDYGTAAAPASDDSAGASAAALAAWRNYAAALDARYASASAQGRFFAGAAPDWRDRTVSGDVSIVKVDPPAVPDARIHHWVGAIFVPGLTVAALLERLERNAGRESEFYDDVVSSKLIARDGDRLKVFMKLRRTSVITVTYNTEHAIEYRRISASRASARSTATKIAELDHAGTATEREKPPAEDRGFLWGLNAYWRYEAVGGGGVLIECESVSLSRPVPMLVRPIANPIVDRIARESLERTLRSLRAVLSRPA